MDALFGGSFDPVHLGHLVAAETAAEELGARVRLMPVREQPFKRAAHGATAAQRAEMLSLALAGNPRLSVERIELELAAPSYTVRTLRELAEREPGNRFTLLLGADAARDLPAWFEVEALPALADVIVFGRPGAPVPDLPIIRRAIEVPAVDISATLVRHRVAEGRSIRYLVPDAVREYITAHGLYR
ncbi:MAG TPA: nicotinate (nicotinamide) nucleotide adenylyltransferase [Gemmatimonadales bacterium]